MLLGATLQTAEKEKQMGEREKKGRMKKQKQTEHTKARLSPGEINHQMEIDERKNAAEVLSNQETERRAGADRTNTIGIHINENYKG